RPRRACVCSPHPPGARRAVRGSASSRSFCGLLVGRAAERGGGIANCLDDVLVPRASAEIAGNADADLFFRRLGIFLDQAIGSHDHARRAEAALQGVHLAKRILQGMELAIGPRDALDGEDLGALRLRGKYRAGFDRLAVEVDGTGAAMRRIAADVRPGEIELLAEDVDAPHTGLDQSFARLAVPLHRTLKLGHERLPVRLRAPRVPWRGRAPASASRPPSWFDNAPGRDCPRPAR